MVIIGKREEDKKFVTILQYMNRVVPRVLVSGVAGFSFCVYIRFMSILLMFLVFCYEKGREYDTIYYVCLRVSGELRDLLFPTISGCFFVLLKRGA